MGYPYGRPLYITGWHEYKFHLLTAAFNISVLQEKRFEYTIGIASGAGKFHDIYMWPYKENIHYKGFLDHEQQFLLAFKQTLFPGH